MKEKNSSSEQFFDFDDKVKKVINALEDCFNSLDSPGSIRDCKGKLQINIEQCQQLFEKYRRKVIEFQNLISINRVINSSLNTQKVLHYAMEMAEDLTNAETSSIWEIDEDTGELFFRVARGAKSNEIEPIRLKLGEGIAGYVAQKGKSLIINDVSKEPRWSGLIDTRSGFVTKSLICVPLRLKKRVIGAIEAINKKDGGSFNQEDLEVLLVLADQVALALENARMHAEMLEKQKMKQKMEDLRFVDAKKTELLNMVAHELRSPLTNIIGFTEMLQEAKVPEKDKANICEIISKESRRLNRIVNGMLDLARIKSGKQKLNLMKFPINSCIEEVVDSFSVSANEKELDISTDLIDPSPIINADRDKIMQVLINLVSNAVKYTHSGGKIIISNSIISEKIELPNGGEIVENKDDEEIEESEKDFVKVSVSDTGPGISKNDIEKIFDEFHSPGEGFQRPILWNRAWTFNCQRDCK